MTAPTYGSFRDITAEIFSRRHVDPILHILALTYEFDDLQLQNLVCGNDLEADFELRQAQLKVLCDIRPVVIYDARKTKEALKLPQFLELHPWKSRAWSCHHSKAYLVVTTRQVNLVLGSFNLTFTGLFRNREVFEHLRWSIDNTEESSSPNLLREWIVFLTAQCLTRLQESSQSALRNIVDTLIVRLANLSFPESAGTVHLLSSGYEPAVREATDDPASNGSGLDQLVARWSEQFPGQQPVRVVAASPFFDQLAGAVQSGLAAELKRRFPGLSQLTIVTDEKSVSELTKKHFGGIPQGELFPIPYGISPEERRRLTSAAKATGRSMQDVQIERKLHAKVLLLEGASGGLVYFGSANFSSKAWLGANQELGLVRRVDHPAKLREEILKGLGASREDQFGQLPESSTSSHALSQDDEEYREDGAFPDYIELVSLRPEEGTDRLRFVFELGSRESRDGEAGELVDFDVTWGGMRIALTELDSSQLVSQPVEKRDFQARLLGGRNIKLTHRHLPCGPYFLPFQYDGELVADRDVFVHPSSWDWMAFYLNPELGIGGGTGSVEFVPGEASNAQIPDGDLFAVEREKNLVIAMQGYLSLFARIEREFMKRRARLDGTPPEKRRSDLAGQLVEPLAALAKLLLREATGEGSDPARDLESFVFKLGELLLLTCRLMQGLDPSERALFDAWTTPVRAFLDKWTGPQPGSAGYTPVSTSDISLIREYAAFVNQEAKA
jgi:HKD family nuclease